MKVNFKEVDLGKATLGPWSKQTMVGEFVKKREAYVDLVNPMYEVWNKDFDNTYPELDGTSKEYKDFITERQQVFVDEVNERTDLGKHVELRLDGEGDVYAYMPKYEIELHLTISE